jgi:hypothetical protein
LAFLRSRRRPMRGKPRTADCTIFAVCLMVEGRMVVMGEGDEEERKKGRREEGEAKEFMCPRMVRSR